MEQTASHPLSQRPSQSPSRPPGPFSPNQSRCSFAWWRFCVKKLILFSVSLQYDEDVCVTCSDFGSVDQFIGASLALSTTNSNFPCVMFVVFGLGGGRVECRQHMGISIWDAKRILADDFVTALPKGSDGDVSGPDESALPYRQSTVPVREVLALQFERERDVLVHSADRQLQIRRLSDPTHVLSDVQAHSNIIWYGERAVAPRLMPSTMIGG